MIIDGLTYITGIDNSIQGCKDLYNKEYKSAARNFAEASVRGTAILLCANIAGSILNPRQYPYDGPVSRVNSFCFFGGDYDVRQRCLEQVFNKFPQSIFEAIISKPWALRTQVEEYCHGTGLNMNEKCWNLISNNTQLLERLLFKV